MTLSMFSSWSTACPSEQSGFAIAFGLNVLWAIIAMVVGTLLGMAFTALHAVQGRASACRR
jgi:purine-cytosine permease-like protein